MNYGLFLKWVLSVAALLWDVGASALSLEEAVARAQRDNALLQAASNQVEAARARALESWAGFLPSVRISEQVVRSNDAVNAFGFRLKQARFSQADFAVDRLNAPDALSNFQTQIAVSQPLFSGGRALHSRRQAQAGARLAKAQLAQQRAEVRQQTAAAYWNLVLAQAALETARESAQLTRADADVVDARYGQGMALGTERLAAQLRALEADVETRTAADGVAAASEGLSLLMGLEATAPLAPTQGLSGRVDLPPLEELVEGALGMRADLQVAEHGLEAARRGVGAAQAAHWPQLSAFASAALDADAPLARQGDSWTVGAMMVWELPAASTIGQVRRAVAQRGQAQAQLDFQRAQVERQVRAAHRALAAALERVAARQRGVELAAERRRIAQLQYDEAMVTATELLDARTALTAARLGYLQAQCDVRIGLATLELAAGSILEHQMGDQQ